MHMQNNMRNRFVSDFQALCRPSGIANVSENELLVLQCKILFSGEIDAVIHVDWFKNGIVVETGMVQTILTGMKHVVATLTSTLRQQINSTDNGADLAFKTTFRQRNNSREITITQNFTVVVFCE